MDPPAAGARRRVERARGPCGRGRPGLAAERRPAPRAAGAIAALLAALLTACATAPPPAAGPVRSGRLALQVAAVGDTPAHALSAGFELRGDATAGTLRLSSPIGPQLAAARWAPGRAVLDAGHGERPFPDLPALAQAAFGEPLPLQALPDWLDGRPWAGAPSVATAQGFDQLGWSLDLSRRADGALLARRVAPPEVALRVRLDAPY
ncbi:MAG: lipoprotein insertase outer membrane protein LolB [Rubrivivax sp.]